MRRSLLVLLLALLASGASPAQFRFLPEGKQFRALRANLQEARLGVWKFLDRGEMKVDVGNAIDLFAARAGGVDLAAGIDFFAYAYTTGAQGLRLQIDAIDGFFGGSLSAACGDSTGRSTARLRLLHQSAHLVDGHYSVAAGRWLGDRSPVPYTRDFGELVLAREERARGLLVRPYAGFSYATLVRPAEVGRTAYLAGIEAATDAVAGPLWSRPVTFFAAYQATLTGVGAYRATHTVEAGVKFGEWNGMGPALYLAWHHGRHMFAEYYDRDLDVVGAGFTVDFY